MAKGNTIHNVRQESAVIGPGRDASLAEKLLAIFRSDEWRISLIVNTQTHEDRLKHALADITVTLKASIYQIISSQRTKGSAGFGAD